MRINRKSFKPSQGFFVASCVIAIVLIAGKPTARLLKEKYDLYKANTTTLTASETEYQRLKSIIQAQQPRQPLDQPIASEFAIPERIFQAAIDPDLLGRSSQYEPNTSNGKLACAWMVNKVLKKALNYQIGQNLLYVPSMVEELDRGTGRRIKQSEARRGDLAIANGTDYENGLWHIGICANEQCQLVLSNSPFTTQFNWLSDANFEGAFDQYPGKTTFYRVVKSSP
jgi:hypothetical protein